MGLPAAHIRRRIRGGAAALIALTLGCAWACSLNPQPIPPQDNAGDFGDDKTARGDATAPSDNGAAGAGAGDADALPCPVVVGCPPPKDGGADAADAGDASDAALDGGGDG